MLEHSHLISQFDQAPPKEKNRIINDLLKIFICSADMLERNRIAFFFADYQIAEAVPMIMNIIQNPMYQHQIGSLIYALRQYSFVPTEYLFDFIPIVADGKFEAAHESYSLISEQINHLNEEEVEKIRALLIDRDFRSCANKGLVLDLLDELQ